MYSCSFVEKQVAYVYNPSAHVRQVLQWISQFLTLEWQTANQVTVMYRSYDWAVTIMMQ